MAPRSLQFPTSPSSIRLDSAQATLVNKFNSILSRNKRAAQIRLGSPRGKTTEERTQRLLRLLDNGIQGQDKDPQLSNLLDTLKEMMQEEEQERQLKEKMKEEDEHERQSLVKSTRKEVSTRPLKVTEVSGIPPPPDTVTHEELAPPAPGCRSIATTTCHHKPNVVSR